MKKVNKKKGFTLAELLVVLAILAILVAVAVPLFTGAISNAQKTAVDANYRAIRAAAVTKILTSNDADLQAGPAWTATANIGANGEMTNLAVSKCDTAPANSHTPDSKVDGSYTVGIADVNATP